MSEAPEDPVGGLARRGALKVTMLETEKAKRDQAKAEREQKQAEQKAKEEVERRRNAPKLEDLESFTEAELEAMVIEPIPWLVNDMLHVGIWICSAAPKIGKSFLMTALCRAVSTGTVFANWRQAVQGNVIYLDLEGTKQRAQSRQRRIRGDWGQGSENFRTFFRFPPMDVDGLDELRKAIAKWDAKLVVIDVWGAFRPMRTKNEDAYAYDRRSLGKMIEMVQELGISVILVHHDRKQADPDGLSEVSGSTALTGGVDGILQIKRGRGNDMAILKITPRDGVDAELAMRFDGGLWTIIGNAKEHWASENRKTIHGLLTNAGAPGMAVKDLVEMAELPRGSVVRTLRKMIEDQIVRRLERGRYALIF